MWQHARSIWPDFVRDGGKSVCCVGGVTLLLALATAAGCKFETGVVPSTQVVVDLDADSAVRERTQELRIRVSSASHRDRLDERVQVWQRVYPRPTAGDIEVPLFPMRIVLTPKQGDARRAFEFLATSVGADGQELTQVRVMSGYVEHQVRHLRARLAASCAGVSCGDSQSCRAGVCAEAWREPRDLPLLGSRKDRPEPPEPAPDAAIADAAEPADAAEAPDAAVDAALTDAEAQDSATGGGHDSGPAPVRCEVDHGGCDPLVTCADGEAGVRCGQCPSGFWDQHGDGTRCTDIDECLSDNGGCDSQHATCTNRLGGYDCTCETGYFGDGRECTRNVPCMDDPAVCDTLASCIDWGGKRLCVCGPGYEGDGAHCRDIDECARGGGRCTQNAHCVNSEGSFSCACNQGYLFKDGACVDLDECAMGSDDCDGDPEACVNEPGGFKCVCPAGYQGTGVGSAGCSDIDECTSGAHNCAANGSCVNKPGSFSCACKPGYSGNGTTCTDIDECSLVAQACDVNARCTNTDGSFTCRCKRGYAGDGVKCTDVDECKLDMDDCSADATCTNSAGSFGCSCNPGFTGDGRTCAAMPASSG